MVTHAPQQHKVLARVEPGGGVIDIGGGETAYENSAFSAEFFYKPKH